MSDQTKYAFEDSPEFWLSLARRVIVNSRPYKRGSTVRWAVVSDITGHGSTYSKDLCKYFGVDPDEMMRRR